MIPEGFEPLTYCLEVWDSSQMQQSEQMEAYQPPKIEGGISQELTGRVEQDN